MRKSAALLVDVSRRAPELGAVVAALLARDPELQSELARWELTESVLGALEAIASAVGRTTELELVLSRAGASPVPSADVDIARARVALDLGTGIERVLDTPPALPARVSIHGREVDGWGIAIPTVTVDGLMSLTGDVAFNSEDLDLDLDLDYQDGAVIDVQCWCWAAGLCERRRGGGRVVTARRRGDYVDLYISLEVFRR